MIVSVHGSADEELIKAAAYYAECASPQLAEDFLNEFAYAVSLISEHPELGATWRGKASRFPLRRFPYSIVYYQQSEIVRIVAVAHQRRKPGYWSSRA